MAQVAITIEGGLFSADLLERLGSRPDDVPGQRPADFGLDGARLSEEIQATFSDVQRQWQTFEGRRARHQGSATTLTRDLWMLPVLGLLGFDLTYQRAALQAGGAGFTIRISPATRKARRQCTSSPTTRSSIAAATPARARTPWSRTT